MNELKLSLHNFQSITEGELVFKTGLNFIIGQSNSGKSATFRALKACLLNTKGSQRFIKKGTNKAEVTLYYNGNEVVWDRTSKESTYKINGEVYYKTGSSNALKILNDEAGFARDDNGVLMNIEEELQLPFPFGISHSDLFKLFENVFCVSDSAIILKSAKEYEKGVENEISADELELQKTTIKMRELREFKEFVNLSLLRKYKDKLEKSQDRLTVLSDGKEIIDKAVKIQKSKLEVREETFKDLFSPYLTALECKKVLTQTRQLHVIGKNLQELVYNTSDLTKKYEELKSLQKLIIKVKALKNLSLSEEEFNSRLGKYNELSSLNKTLNNLKNLNKIKAPERDFENRLSRYTELKALYLFVQNLQRELKDLEIDKKREKENVAIIEAKLKEFKVCPLCHHSLED